MVIGPVVSACLVLVVEGGEKELGRRIIVDGFVWTKELYQLLLQCDGIGANRWWIHWCNGGMERSKKKTFFTVDTVMLS
jgi:hypothetical protein